MAYFKDLNFKQYNNFVFLYFQDGQSQMHSIYV